MFRNFEFLNWIVLIRRLPFDFPGRYIYGDLGDLHAVLFDNQLEGGGGHAAQLDQDDALVLVLNASHQVGV